jgi:uncharacterized protein (TIGR03118 family)
VRRFFAAREVRQISSKGFEFMKLSSSLFSASAVGRGVVALAALATLSGTSFAAGYETVLLVSDQSGVAGFSDPRLVNAWGIASTGEGLLFVADNGTGLSTVYPPSGIPIPFSIHIPLPTGAMGAAAPSGIAFNATDSFRITHGSHTRPARFLYATEDGTISGWNPVVAPTDAILAVDNSANNSVYKGIAWTHSTEADVLYATDFHNRHVDMFDGSFAPLHVAGAFEDPHIPLDYSPFGIRVIDDQVFVTYAKLKAPDNHDDEPGAGHGFIDVFHPDGSFVKRLVTHGALNSPWGLAHAPANFGQFSLALLVGNFGDGTIHAYDRATGAFLGTLNDSNGHPLAIDGLWGLEVGAGAAAVPAPILYFTAGPEGESHGLLGVIHAAHSPGS